MAEIKPTELFLHHFDVAVFEAAGESGEKALGRGLARYNNLTTGSSAGDSAPSLCRLRGMAASRVDLFGREGRTTVRLAYEDAFGER